MNLKRKTMEIGIKEHSSGFAWVMKNMGNPGIKDLLYPGLESHGKCGSWEAMENKVIWAVLHLKTKETGKSYTQSRNVSKKNGQI